MSKQTTFILCSLLVFCFSAFAQRDSITLKKAAVPEDSVSLKQNGYTVTDRPPQAIYAELFGKAIIFSVNYDRRFSKRTDGLGFMVGLGYVESDGASLFSLPFSLNYLLGKKGKFLELGAGATYLSGSATDISNISSSGSSFIGNLTIGYRSQPEHGGFMFRAGITPFFFKNNFLPYYPYVSFGYNF